jgi:Acetyltransferase (GNAT) domain
MVRPPREADRDRFVELFCDEDFMAFYPSVLTEAEAKDRFAHMVAVCQAIPFGKQPVVELSSGLVVGYTGIDYIDFEGTTWLEWGYRLAARRQDRAQPLAEAVVRRAGVRVVVGRYPDRDRVQVARDRLPGELIDTGLADLHRLVDDVRGRQIARPAKVLRQFQVGGPAVVAGLAALTPAPKIAAACG